MIVLDNYINEKYILSADIQRTFGPPVLNFYMIIQEWKSFSKLDFMEKMGGCDVDVIGIMNTIIDCIQTGKSKKIKHNDNIIFEI